MDLDKIIKGLDICSQEKTCLGCPYDGQEGCASTMKNNAIAAIQELRAKAEHPKASGALQGMIDDATMEAITGLRDEVAAQVQAIETLQAINTRLEGKVEAYEYALRLAIE